ncbi:MAG TPA: MFS transporter [Galbitalea sp.]|nr:MFS transporter [Galbitalea sp.]
MTTTPATARPAHTHAPGVAAWRNALFVVFAACGISISSLAARIPTISLALSLTTAEVGVLLSAMAVGSIIGLVASGHLVANIGAKRTILLSYSVLAVSLAVAGFGIAAFGSFGLSFGALIVLGASMGTCDVAMNVSGAANERAIGRTVMPVYHAFFSIGTVIGAGLGSLAEALDIPLQLHVTVLAILTLASIILVSRFLLSETAVAAGEEPHPTSTWRSRLAIWRDPRTLLIGLIVLGFAFTEGSSNDWLAYSMVHGHGTSRAIGAAVYGVFVAAMTIGRLAGVRVLDHFGRVPVLRATAALAAVGLLLFIFVPVFWIDMVGVVFWGLGASLGFPVGMSAAADDPRRAAARVSAVASIGYLALLVGPPSIGFLGNQFGILNALLLVLLLVAMAGAFSFAARKPQDVTS